MARKNLPLFDQPAQYSPRGMEDYVSRKNEDMGYQPYQQGFLSLLGAGISGGIAPFVGDNQWLERRTKQQMEQAQSEAEFRALLLKQRQQGMENQQSRDFQNKYLEILKTQAQGQPLLQDTNTAPSLADAFPVKEQKLLTKQGFSTSGKPFTSQTVDPEYQKSLELRNANIKDLKETSDAMETFSVGIKQLRDAIEGTPEYKPGFASKPLAAAQNLYGNITNAPWYTNYDIAYQQNVLPAAQTQGASKVLSDRDLQNIIKSLGEYELPKKQKIEALDKLQNKVGAKLGSTLKAYGVDKSVYSQIYPNISNTFNISSDKGSSINTQGWNDQKEARLQELRKKLGK